MQTQASSSTTPSYYAQFKQFSIGQKCFLCGVPALTAATVITFLRHRGVPIITASVCTSFVTLKVLKWSWLRCQKAVVKSAQKLQEQPIGPKLPAPAATSVSILESKPQAPPKATPPKEWRPDQYKNIWLTTSELGREGHVENGNFDPFAHLRNPDSALPLPAGVKGFTASGESLGTWGANHFKKFILDIAALHDTHGAQPTHAIGQMQVTFDRPKSSRSIRQVVGKPVHLIRDLTQPVLYYGAGLKHNNLCLLIGYIMWDGRVSYEEALGIVKNTYSDASLSKKEQEFLQDFQQHLVNAHERAVKLLD